MDVFPLSLYPSSFISTYSAVVGSENLIAWSCDDWWRRSSTVGRRRLRSWSILLDVEDHRLLSYFGRFEIKNLEFLPGAGAYWGAGGVALAPAVGGYGAGAG